MVEKICRNCKHIWVEEEENPEISLTIKEYRCIFISKIPSHNAPRTSLNSTCIKWEER